MSRMAAGINRVAIAALIAVVITGGFAQTSLAQKRTSQPSRRAPQLKQPLSPFNQGYQKGYTEGFVQGEADWSANRSRDSHGSDRWQQRDSGWSEEYRQGYELGFELGHTDGYYGRARNTVVPRNAEVLAKAAALADRQRTDRRADDDRQRDVNRPRTGGPLVVPAGTELRIRLGSQISTKTGRVGEKFSAIVVSPSTYESGTVEGHITSINKSGRVSGKTELSLAFDSLTLNDGRQTRIDAELVKVYESENVKKVDEEGHVESGSRTRETGVRGGAGAAAGAILGGIIGGGKGAVIGAIIGGAAGIGSLYVEGDKDLILDPGTEMVIRTVRSRER